MADQFVISVFTVVFDDHNRVLLGHRCDMDLWDLPGGGMDYGELPNEAAIREAKEETGFDIEIIQLLGIFSSPATEKAQLVFAFSGKIKGGQPTLSAETDDVRFFDANRLPENTSPRKRVLIEIAVKGVNEPMFTKVNLPHAREWLANKKNKASK